MIIYYDFKSEHFNKESSRSGGSKRTTWKNLDDIAYLKDVSFGVVSHPFNPKEISFRRKTFTPYRSTHMGGKDYGIAIKGTQISEEEYQSLIADTNPMPMTIRKLFHRYGEKFYQSYPSLVKSFKKQDQMGNATMNPSLTGTRSIQANRKFPSVVCEDSNGVGFRVHFVPRPVFAMQILPYQINCGILFDKKQSAKTWVDWHGQISNDYSDMIKQRVA